jgi:hypothetical protein
MGNSSSSSSRRSSSSNTSGGTSTNQGQNRLVPPQQHAPLNISPNQGANSSAGAFKMPGQARSNRYYVQIPRGVRPGQHFAVLVNGAQMMVKCPEGNQPGDRLIVTAPRQQTQQYVVMVPNNVRPGQQFRVVINNQEVMVTCPRGVQSGQRVTFQLPSQSQQPTPNTSPNHQMFEVIVPRGVMPGQPFALMANGQKVMVTCPQNVKPGQKIRFQLPIHLSSEQLSAVKLSYDKDGWMRCLGQDLKFHWAYNKQLDENGNALIAASGEVAKATLIPYDVEMRSFVREIYNNTTTNDKNAPAQLLRLIPATEYGIVTSVPGTSVNYNELASIGSLSFLGKKDWLKNQFNSIRIPWEEGHIKIRVRRESVLADAVDAWLSIDAEDMKKIFRFEFIGEPALDAGGVAREFYTLVCEQLFNADVGLFMSSSTNQMCMQINPNSDIANDFHLRYFHMAGRILGKAFMDDYITPVHLVRPLYKMLMAWPINMTDLEHIDNEIYRGLMNLLDIDDISYLYLEFSVTEDRLGQSVGVDLIENGSNISVDNDNLPKYLDIQLQYRLCNRIKNQLLEFCKGFYDVVPEPLLSVLDFQELELLLHGLPTIDMDDWISNTVFTGEFAGQPNHKVVQWFWEVVREYEQEQKAKLLQFVTGTSGVPVAGFAALQGNDGNVRQFTLHGDKNVKVLPRAHTCFNRLDCPIYKTKADMRKFLTIASMECTSGFGIE